MDSGMSSDTSFVDPSAFNPLDCTACNNVGVRILALRYYCKN